MKRYLLTVLAVFLLETLLLALLQDRPLLASYMHPQDRLLTDAFLAAWPLGLIVYLFRRKRQASQAAPKAKGGARKKPAKRKKKSGGRATSHS